MVIVILVYLIEGNSSSIVLSALLILWLVIWLVFGRFLWKHWQYYAAGRELLFIDQEQLIVRRPVSILGLTSAYDMAHISPFYHSDTHNRPAFDYAYLHVYFGQGLTRQDSEQLVSKINQRWFPEPDEIT